MAQLRPEELPAARPGQTTQHRGTSPTTGFCSCLATVLAVGASLSSYLLWATTASANYAVGPFVASQVALLVTSSNGARSIFTAGYTFADLDDTVCLDETLNTTLGTETLEVNNFEDWAGPGGFCDVANGPVRVPAAAQTLQALIIITAVLGLLTTLAACGACGFSKKTRPYTVVGATAGAAGVTSLAGVIQAGSWSYLTDLRNGTGRVPIRVVDGSDEVVYFGLPAASLSFGPSFYALLIASFILFALSFRALRERRRIKAATPQREDDDLAEAAKRQPVLDLQLSQV